MYNFFRARKLKYSVIAALTMGSTWFCPLADAEVRSYTGVGEYAMSDFETPEVAKQRAKARAEQNAIEQAGVYVESYTKTINSQVAHDEIAVMANGIIRITATEYVMTINEGQNILNVKSIIKVDIDTDDVLKWLEQNKQERDILIKENEILKKDNLEKDKELEEIKKRLNEEKTEEGLSELKNKVKKVDKEFISNQKIEEAMRYAQKRKFNVTLELLNEAVEINKDNANAYFNRGLVYVLCNDFEKSISDFSKALSLGKKEWYVYSSRGHSCYQLGKYKQAIEDYKEAISLGGNNDTNYAKLGSAYLGLGDEENALINYNKAVEENVNSTAAYLGMSYYYMKKGKYTEGKECLEKVIDIDKENFVAYNMLGMCSQYMKQNSEAMIYYDKSIRINPGYGNWEGFFGRGNCNEKLGKYENAIDDYSKAIELYPNLGFIYYQRALCYKAMRMHNKAKQDMDKYREIEGSNK